jgi:hypothetical protein
VFVDIENVGETAAVGARTGLSPWRVMTGSIESLLIGCRLIAGTGTCPSTPARGAEFVISLDAGASMRLEYAAFDPGYRHARRTTLQPTRFGARAFVDAPYDYGDTEPGNNVVGFALRLAGFVDSFE